jgi:hypothetical protein
MVVSYPSETDSSAFQYLIDNDYHGNCMDLSSISEFDMEECCFAPLFPEEVGGIRGFSNAFPPSGEILSHPLPKSTLGAEYCLIDFSSSYLNNTLSYTQGLYHADSLCKDGFVKCSSSQVSIYEQGSDCSGSPETFTISKTLQSLSSLNQSTLEMKLIKVDSNTDLKMTYLWRSNFPYSSFIITMTSDFFPYFCEVGKFLGILISLVTGVYYWWKQRQAPSNFKLLFCVCNFIFFTYGISDIILSWVPMEGLPYYIVGEIDWL